MPENFHTVILGSGITGLCVAHSLHQSGKSFKILEKAHTIGGAIQTTTASGYLAEHGPNSLLLKDKRIAKLLDDTGLLGTQKLTARTEAKKRYIVQDGLLHAMPSSAMEILRTPLFSIRGKFRLALEPFIGRYNGPTKDQTKSRDEESFAAFVRRRLGAEMLASAAEPFVSGIYAGNPEKLSVRHAFPRLWKLENQYRSCIAGAVSMQLLTRHNPHRHTPTEILSFQSGMHAMPDAIAAQLPAENIRLSSSITNIEPLKNGGWLIQWSDHEGTHASVCRHLVCNVPHHKLDHLPFPTPIFQTIRPVLKLESPPVTSLVFGFKRADIAHPLDGFGLLIKQSEKSPLLGILFSSSMFDGRAPDGHVTLTCMMGGSIHPHYAENDDATVLAELNRLLGVSGKPTFRHKTTWENAIPQYNLDYQHVVDALTSVEKQHSGLHFVGNYRGGISVGDCIINGLDLGKKISS